MGSRCSQISNPMLFKNIANVGSFIKAVCIFAFVFLHLTHGNDIFDILESLAFKRYF